MTQKVRKRHPEGQGCADQAGHQDGSRIEVVRGWDGQLAHQSLASCCKSSMLT